jgi:hypothetical protein
VNQDVFHLISMRESTKMHQVLTRFLDKSNLMWFKEIFSFLTELSTWTWFIQKENILRLVSSMWEMRMTLCIENVSLFCHNQNSWALSLCRVEDIQIISRDSFPIWQAKRSFPIWQTRRSFPIWQTRTVEWIRRFWVCTSRMDGWILSRVRLD